MSANLALKVKMYCNSVGGKIISGQNLPIAGRTAIARGGKIRQNDFWPFLDVGEV